jgi:hypothetical protein
LLHLVAIGERILSLLGGLAKHVLRVFVVAHQEMGIEPRQPAVSRNDVGGDLFVGRAQMGPAVDEIDRRSQKVTHSICYSLFVVRCSLFLKPRLVRERLRVLDWDAALL